jgi:hypothetical protein
MSSGPGRDARFLDPRIPLPPNNPSCGNQPAHISLDHASNTDTHATHRPDRPKWSGARTTSPDAASPCPT